MPPPDGTVHDGTMQALIRRLPIPAILFGIGTDGDFANDRYLETLAPGQRDCPDLLRLTREPGQGWKEVELRRRDQDSKHSMRAQAVAIPEGVLVLIDDDPAGTLSVEEQKRLHARITELENLSVTDFLTGACNRLHLDRVVQVEMSRAARLEQSVSLILLDIDHFKRVNDTHGHLVGDAVLKEFVERIRGRVRSIDSVFRWGGEEFAVLAIGVGYRGGAALAESLRKTIAAEPFATVGLISASLGVAEYVEGESAESWFLRVDQALYAAKAGGRNKVCVDQHGTSDLGATHPGAGVLRLTWREAYECGESTIDAEHRQLFELGNALISVALEPDSAPALRRAALDRLLTHVAQHFKDEEALLALHGYAALAAHQRAHAGLLRRAEELRVTVTEDDGALGALVNFLAKDVIAEHMFKVDREFYPLFQGDGFRNT